MTRAKPGKGTKAIAKLSLDRFMGPVHVSSVFDVDGRGGDYDFVFEWDPEEPALWSSADGDYAIGYLDEFDPPTVVLRHRDETVGFYMSGELWIDEGHRGQGLSSEMILASAEWQGKVPFPNKEGLGFSPAGYAAHRRAHELAVSRSLAPAPEASPAPASPAP